MRSRTALSSEHMAIGLLFVVLVVLAAMVKAQSDTWWLLRSGEEIWRSGSVSFTDTYSYTARGRYWPNHEWLTEVLFYLFHRAGGMALLAAFCTAAITLAYALSWQLTTGRFDLRFGLFAFSLSEAVGAWSMRPQVVSLACFMVTCRLLASDRVWWLPPLFVLWANLHGAVGLGLISLAAVMVSDGVRHRRVDLRLLVASVACFAATAATPMGSGLWRLLFAYGQRSSTRDISEWMPPGLPPAHPAFWITGSLLVIMSALRWRRLDMRADRLTAVAVVTLPLALSAQRNIAPFLLIAVPAVAALVAAGTRKAESPAARDFTIGNGVMVGIAVTSAVAFIGFMWMKPPARLNWAPIQSTAIAAIRRCQPPVYNPPGFGGVMIRFVPEQPVFVDNRNDPYPVEFLQDNWQLERTGQYESLFDRYAIRCAIAETNSLTGDRLQRDRNWSRTYADDTIVVFERR